MASLVLRRIKSGDSVEDSDLPPESSTTSINPVYLVSPKASPQPSRTNRVSIPLNDHSSPPIEFNEARSRRKSAFYDDHLEKHQRCRFSLKFMMVVSLCFFTLAPAVIIWTISFTEARDAVNKMYDLGTSSLEVSSKQLRSSLTLSASDGFRNLVQPIELIMNACTRLMLAHNLAAQNYTYETYDFSEFKAIFDERFYDIKANPYLSEFNPNLLFLSGTFQPGVNLAWIVQWYTWNQMNNDVLTGSSELTAYEGMEIANEYRNDTYFRVNYLDQTTGQPLFTMANFLEGSSVVGHHTFSANLSTHWESDISFNLYTGVPGMLLITELPSWNHNVYYTLWITVNVYTVSSILLSLLTGEQQRLYLTFRSQGGVLIGASHGKFFSHSDVDFTYYNFLTNPPPVSQFRTYSPMNSTDPTIKASAVWFLQTYGGWDRIPEINTDISLLGEEVWLSNDYVTSMYGLNVQLTLIVNQRSVFGAINDQQARTEDRIKRFNNTLISLFSCVVGVAGIGAFVASYYLTRALNRLAKGMDRVACLEFEGISLALWNQDSRFREVYRCESSFVAMSRGLKAFVKYIPQDVVKMLVAGQMGSGNIMIRKEVTVLFMDIAGFTTISESISPEDLTILMTSYFQEMCGSIVSSGGVLDKFIGDCIMAMWNAPKDVDNHASAACAASSQMQLKLQELWSQWNECSLPLMRFRVGINTASVLVGNLGCDYRVNYTCMGDGVNLASRLEAANKPFKTVVLVAESTFNAASAHFAFRKIGLITVPGKTEVIAVYEPLALLSLVHDSNSEPVLLEWRSIGIENINGLKRLYEEGVAQYIAGNFSSAEASFQMVQQIFEQDGPSKLMITLCKENSGTSCSQDSAPPSKKEPEAKDGSSSSQKPSQKPWDGVVRFDTK